MSHTRRCLKALLPLLLKHRSMRPTLKSLHLWPLPRHRRIRVRASRRRIVSSDLRDSGRTSATPSSSSRPLRRFSRPRRTSACTSGYEPVSFSWTSFGFVDLRSSLDTPPYRNTSSPVHLPSCCARADSAHLFLHPYTYSTLSNLHTHSVLGSRIRTLTAMYSIT